MTVKLNNDNGLQTRWTRTPAGNRRLAQWRETWLIEHSTSHQLLWCIDSFVLRNPPLRQAPNRYTKLLYFKSELSDLNGSIAVLKEAPKQEQYLVVQKVIKKLRSRYFAVRFSLSNPFCLKENLTAKLADSNFTSRF